VQWNSHLPDAGEVRRQHHRRLQRNLQRHVDMLHERHQAVLFGPQRHGRLRVERDKCVPRDLLWSVVLHPDQVCRQHHRRLWWNVPLQFDLLRQRHQVLLHGSERYLLLRCGCYGGLRVAEPDVQPGRFVLRRWTVRLRHCRRLQPHLQRQLYLLCQRHKGMLHKR
jgi:hypothetical protein